MVVFPAGPTGVCVHVRVRPAASRQLSSSPRKRAVVASKQAHAPPEQSAVMRRRPAIPSLRSGISKGHESSEK